MVIIIKYLLRTELKHFATCGKYFNTKKQQKKNV